jgi:hypothetical protein
MIAATLKQMAAPAANVNSEIHMAQFPLSALDFRLILCRAGGQRRAELSVPGTLP